MIRRISLVVCLSSMAVVAMSQTPRSAYHFDSFVFGHDLNPSFQPDSSYYSLPVFGNSSLHLATTMGLDDLLYDTPNGTLSTFMSKGTVSKADLMDKVGSGLKNQSGFELTLASWGFRRDDSRYQTVSTKLKIEENLLIGKEYFDCLKDFQNGSYDLSNASFSLHSYLEIAAGESRKLNEQWTVGGKAKLLLGLAHLKMKIDDLDLDINNEKWTAQGHVSMNASGFAYHSEEKDYKSLEHEGETYQAVTGLGMDGLGFHGLGLAVDMGATYKHNDAWTFSASLLDLGFISWFNGREAKNGGTPFEFKGFTDACLDEPDQYDNQDVYKPNQSVGNQIDRLSDDLMDLAHLEECGKKTQMQMLGATIHAGATYNMPQWTLGALVTSRIQGQYSWYEGRLTGIYHWTDRFDISLSPYYSSFGWGVGTFANYQTKKGHHIYLGSDHLVWKTNKQLIPISLNGTLSVGMSFPL